MRPAQVARVDRRRGRILRDAPDRLARRPARRIGRHRRRIGRRIRLDRHRDDVLPDLDPVAGLQLVRLVQPEFGIVDEGAVPRDVLQPVIAILEPDLAVLARYKPGRIGQRPVEILVAADIDAAPWRHGATERTAVGKRRVVLDLQVQRHSVRFQVAGRPCRTDSLRPSYCKPPAAAWGSNIRLQIAKHSSMRRVRSAIGARATAISTAARTAFAHMCGGTAGPCA